MCSCSCGVCRTCKNRVACRNWRRTHRVASRVLKRERNRVYRRRHPEASTRANSQRTTEQIRARAFVARAIRRGTILPQSCWCGRLDAQAHHRDYSKPLVIEWLCPVHHARKGLEAC